MSRIRLALAVVVLASCGGHVPPPLKVDIVGDWRSVIESPGGELPFGLRILERDGMIIALALNDTEEVPFSGVKVDGERVTLEMDWYDSELEGQLSKDGLSIIGHWRKTVPGGLSELPWRADRGLKPRFRPIDDMGLVPGTDEDLVNLSGSWRVLFTGESGIEEARAEFRQHGRSVTGTFLTPTGDYRFLEGAYDSGLLRLSTFDGAHIFLFRARAMPDGTLAGDFWSRESYHATWVAERISTAEEVLPDPWQQVQATRPDRRFSFSFPDLDGAMVSADDPRFQGKVVLVNLFGSWCPNCNDEAPILAQWSRRWKKNGLEIVGLAFEFSNDVERSRRVLRLFAKRHEIDYPLVLAGPSDKKAAGHAVSDLSAVLSYPTTVFIGRDGAIRWIHSGFAGPGTGHHYGQLLEEMERRIAALLAEPRPSGPLGMPSS